MFNLKSLFSAHNALRPRRATRETPVQPKGEPSARTGWKGLTITLSVGGVLASGIGLIVLLAWVFFFGIIVGRGYNPETTVPGAALLAQIEPDPSAEESESAILRAEELTFFRDLKQPEGAASASPPAAPQAQASAKPSGETTSAATARQTVRETAPQKVDSAANSAPLLDFVFQVATYKSPEPAEALRERLEALGMRTRLSSEKTSSGKSRWYRVNVLLRGTEEAAAGIKADLAAIGIHDALIISRKPAR
ncbi:MAG TPA: SPOR domain-containing protein [Candidatus Avidesulfovibrio excrementigallinarum]|nr:SPOR domain-containing protein [Candidatus Avidesulfovibrio excrementigallinarum]